MKLTIYKYPEKKEDYIWVIDINERCTNLWYNEMNNRWREVRHNPEIKIFDIDESYETGQMSLDHLLEMIKFLKETNKF